MLFKHCSLVQEGESVLFYRYHRALKGYIIAGLFIAPTTAAKLAFVKIWTYFVSEVVKKDDIYCSILPGVENSMFDNYIEFYDTIDGVKLYKVDNALKEQYSSYVQHFKNTI